jgi:hypothetical protein
MELHQWIVKVPVNKWRPETFEYTGKYTRLRIQRSFYYNGQNLPGLTIQKIETDEKFRKTGRATYLIKDVIEETAKKHGLAYVLIQSISSDEMDSLARTLGYEDEKYTYGSDRIKFLCATCGSSATLMCSKTRVIYCSQKCQAIKFV